MDFSPLRPVLALLLGWTSARGQVPFDPVSIFLLIGWQITNGWSRAKVLRNIRKRCYADYARRFGFKNGVFPIEGGLRYWLTALGQNSTSEETVLVDQERQIEIAVQRLNHVLAQSVTLLVEAGFLSPEAWNQALICPDGMIHFSIVLLDDFLPANAREENPSTALLRQLATFYPDLSVDAVAGDAAFGYDVVLRTVYHHLRARRVIDLRANQSDKNKALWPEHGYDDKGRPIWPYGYALKANGFDAHRQRHKWACFHACRNGTTPAVFVSGAIYPPGECPHLKRPYGQLINVGERFKKDGAMRLVRDIPVGTPAWKRIYHRARNAVEARNAAFEHWDLKRLPVYGSPRGKATIFQADVWLNLITLARLVREATAATGSN